MTRDQMLDALTAAMELDPVKFADVEDWDNGRDDSLEVIDNDGDHFVITVRKL